MIGDLTLECAKVVSIEDKDKQGKIQINIESKFKNFKKDLLPWVIPLFSDTSSDTMSFNPPSVDSQVWILRDEYWKRFYYLTNRYFYNLFDFSKVKGLLDKCDKINKDYQNIVFRYFKDKTLIFHNNEDGSSGIVNSQGTFVYIDKDGSFVREIKKDELATIKGKMEYNIDGDVTLKSPKSSKFEIGNTVSTLGKILEELCNDLSQLTTMGSPSTHTSPTLTSQMTSLNAKIKQVFK